MSTRAALVAVEPAALTRRFPDDGFLRWELAAGRSAAEGGAAEGGAAAWVLAGAWAHAKTVDGRSRVVAGGDPADAADLLAALVPARVVPERLSVVREAVGLLRADLAPVGGDDWDWFATTRAPTPRLPGEDRAVRADVADPVVLVAVLELLDGHSPRYSPGSARQRCDLVGDPGHLRGGRVRTGPCRGHRGRVAPARGPPGLDRHPDRSSWSGPRLRADRRGHPGCAGRRRRSRGAGYVRRQRHRPADVPPARLRRHPSVAVRPPRRVSRPWVQPTGAAGAAAGSRGTLTSSPATTAATTSRAAAQVNAC